MGDLFGNRNTLGEVCSFDFTQILHGADYGFYTDISKYPWKAKSVLSLKLQIIKDKRL